jgi:hypothetical protein
MAYNVAANLRQTRPGAAYLEGRDGALRNALAERQMAGQEQNALFNQNRLTQQDQANQAAAQQKAQQEQERAELERGHSEVLRILAAPPGQKRAVAEALFDDEDRAEFASEGIDFNALDDDGLQQLASRLENQLGSQLGIAPTQQKRYEDVRGPRGAMLQRDPATGELKQVVGPDNSQSAAAGQSWRPLTPQEIAAAGLPPGTAAQTDGSGKIDVLSKRDATGGLSQKDMTTARQKLNTISIARRQLQNIKDRFGELQGSMSAGSFGQGKLPTPKGKAFDAAVDQMRSTLTALTRVPGVGAMSDYETRLDQAKFPSRQNYEAVTAQQIGYIEEFLNGVEGGYQNMMSGGAQAESAQAGGQGGPVRVNTPEEAAALPSGTEFITPDGRRKVRP